MNGDNMELWKSANTWLRYDIDTQADLDHTFKVEIKASDKAGVFGKGGENNVMANLPGPRFRVVDTTPPQISIDESTCIPGTTTWGESHDCTFECNYNSDSSNQNSGAELQHDDHATYNTTYHWNRPELYCEDKCDSNIGTVISSAPTYENLVFLQDDTSGKLDGSIVHPNDDVTESQLKLIDDYEISWYCEDRKGNRNDIGTRLYVIDTSPPTLSIGCGNSEKLERYSEALPGNGWRHNAVNTGNTGVDCAGHGEEPIYHSAGYIKDLQIIYDLLSEDDDSNTKAGWHCTDTCDHTDLHTLWDHENVANVSTIDGHKDNIAQWFSRPERCEDADSPYDPITDAEFAASTPHNDDLGDTGFTNANNASFIKQTKGFCNEVPGTYIVKYHCQDKSGNSVEKFQTIFNEDHIIPIIHVLGHQHMVLEATTQGNYVDDGAVCTDQIDGMISQNVEVSGDVVNLSKPGTYHIFYDCADSAGRIAAQRTRTVVVADCTCPTCEVFGDKIKTIEASFPYTDSEGANCSDSLQGNIDDLHESNFSKVLNVEKTGTYLITYTVTDQLGHSNIGNENASNPAQSSSYCNQNSACPNVDPSDNIHFRQHVRTIHVVDTLKPVIALKYTDYFHGDTAFDTGVGNEANLASGHHTSVMAELNKPAVNGWLVGAVVSSVTGLAILAYNRRVTVSTAVPV